MRRVLIKLGRLGSLLLLVFAALAVAPAAAHAGDAEKTKNPHLKRAISEYGSFEFDTAREELQKAKRWPANTIKDLALSHLYEGLTLAQLGEFDGAREAFKTALCLNRKTKVPKDTSPKVKQQFKRTRNQLKKEGIRSCQRLIDELGHGVIGGTGGSGVLGKPKNPFAVPGWIGVGVGAAFLATSGVLFGLSQQNLKTAEDKETVLVNVISARDDAQLEASLSLAFLITGVVLAGGGAAALLLWQPPPGRIDEGPKNEAGGDDGKLGVAPLRGGGAIVSYDVSF